MRRLAIAALVAGSAVVGLDGPRATALAQQDGGLIVEVAGAAANSILDVMLNAGKIGEVRAGEGGTGSSALDLANLGKVRVHVFAERCENGRIVRVRLIVDGHAVPEDEDCDRTPIGFFWTDRARFLRINLLLNLLQVDNRGMSPLTKILLGGAGAGAALAALTAAGGGNDPSPATSSTTSPGTPNASFNPAGNYQSSSSVTSDVGGHDPRIALARALLLIVQLSGANMTILGPDGSNWVIVAGTFEVQSQRAVLTGTGTVAGFPNVSVRFEATFSAAGALSGVLVMGTGGELPGGQPTTYSVMGQRP